MWLACWGARCLATAGEISGPLKCTHILAMRLRMFHKETCEAGRVPGVPRQSRDPTLIVRNVLNPWAAIPGLLRVWSLEVVEVPARSLTGLPTTRLPPKDGATGGSLALGSQQLSAFLNGTRVFKKNKQGRTQWQVGTPPSPHLHRKFKANARNQMDTQRTGSLRQDQSSFQNWASS